MMGLKLLFTYLLLLSVAVIANDYDADYFIKNIGGGYGNSRPILPNIGRGIKTSFTKTKSATKTGYGHSSNPFIHAGIKGSIGLPDEIELFDPAILKGGTSLHTRYKGGCNHEPTPPMNGHLKCSSVSGCRAACNKNYQFPSGQTQLFGKCIDGQWRIDVDQVLLETFPACEPVCLPVCENNGICVAPNQCNCPDGFSGPQCQYESKPCLNYPPLPKNSRRLCRSSSCTVTCANGHQFPDGSKIQQLTCKDGNWIPSQTKFVTLPDCDPICDPPCENEGKCLSFNVCLCSKEFRGPQCQYSADICKPRRLNFNGGYNCSGNTDTFSCSLNCPEGANFEFTPAPIYTCSYSTGIFLPTPIPQCLYSPTVHVIGINETGSSHFTTAFSHTTIENSYGEPVNIGGPNHQFGDDLYGIVTIQEKTPEPGSCTTWRGTHFKTFDGKVYSFDSKCAYTLVKDAIDNTFNIVLQNNPACVDDPSSCHKITTIFYQGKEYVLKELKGMPVLTTKEKILPIPSQLPGLRAEMAAHYIILLLDTVGVTLRWDGKLFVQVEVKENLWNRTAGLCGRIDGYGNNDIMTKEGIIPKNIVTMVNSWQTDHLGDECNSVPNEEHACASSSKANEAKVFCEQVLADKRFSACHKVMDITVLMNACQWDYCSCTELDPQTCTCDTLNMYVRECAHKGIKSLTNWRDDSTCPMICTGGRVYMPCSPPGGQDTCGTSIDNGGDTDICEEGCYCPKGLVLHENKCVTRDKCTCRLRGKDFPPGTTVPKNCNTCTCSDGKWVCTQVSCGARCSALGDPHYITFDGKRYDFMGQCSYYLVKMDNFTIEAENIACSGAISLAMNLPTSIATGLPSCTKTVTIRYDGQEIHLKQNQELTVNGKELMRLPLIVRGATIRMVSSIFTVVELSNGVSVWWDGLTRVYVDVPASFKGQTSGLCGTFTENQKDDFLTPENDVEHSVVQFANKWKTSEKCNDIPDKLKQHPCDLNIQNRIIAETHCKKLKSDLFGSCHFFVDPDSYYQDCLYDMCSCEVKLSNCLCPMIAAYAQECALQGIRVDWRNDIKECGVQCSGGQVYQVCGNSCTRTCFDVATTPNCKDLCVEGCNCPEGQSLDDYGECIPISQCQCQLDGLSFSPGYKEVRPASKGQELCTCTNAAWNCKLATPEEIKKFPKASDKKNMCDETKNFEFTTCEPPEPTTCKNMHRHDMYSADVCHAGCTCKDGYVLDTSTRICVKPTQCPCHHGGKSYSENAVVQSDCNTCTCKNGKWECTDRQCAAECAAWGDSHFKTFDGKMYDYQGQCDYVLAKGKLNSVDNFQISIQNVPCGSTGVSCSKSLTIKVGSSTQQEKITLVRHKPVQSPQIFKTFTVRTLDLFVIVEASDLGLVVHWDKGTRVYVKVDPRWKNKICGLCGNYNDNELDDFQTPFGGVSEVSSQLFGDSWKMQSYCPDAEEIKDTCEKRPDRRTWALTKCGVLKSSVFAACHSEVPVDFYYEKCVFDSCACDEGGDCECLCTALAAYAQECNSKGVPVKWRSQELCPIQCDERCAQYSPCVSSCPLETCDNLLIQNPLTKLCKEDSCIEGCTPKPCPPDQVYANSSYSECVPKSICKPICLEVDGVTYYEGDKMEEDDCQTCFCSRGTKTCNGPPCTTITPKPTTPGQLDSKPTCKSGWTTWINQDKLTSTKTSKNRKDQDIEPIPTDIIMNQLKEGGQCEPNKIIDIECRTVSNHMPYKQTGLDVECSLERGLICKSENENCLDFEIRVLCACEQPTTPPTTIIPQAVCDEENIYSEHNTNCHLYFKCYAGENGLEQVEKSCGDYMMFNPTTKACDSPDNVIVLKPECAREEINQCEDGYEWRNCALRCDSVCHYHKYTVRERGECLNDDVCISKCVPVGTILCGPGEFWNSDNSCREKADCICRSKNGTSVKPNQVYAEDECTYCQCVENHYTCTSSCEEESTVELEPEPEGETEETATVILSTVTPPKECLPYMFMNLVQGDQPLPDTAFLGSSYYDDYLPKYAKMNSGNSWKPEENDKEPYLQIDLGRQEPVYGVIVKGNVKDDEYVMTYKVAYIPYNHDKYHFVHSKDRRVQVFRGSVDAITPSKQLFDVPFEATKIRIYPQTWHDAPSLRVELIGCSEIKISTPSPTTTMVTEQPSICEDEMGLQNGMMSLQQVSVSSEQSRLTSKAHLKIDDEGAWQPFTNTPTEWIMFDFLEPRKITGIKTKGNPKGWITQYKLKYSSDDKQWSPIVDDSLNEVIFDGNFDHKTTVTNMFKLPIQARYLKLEPVKWEKNILLKVEPLGCYEPYPVISQTIPPLEATICNYCPGIPQQNETESSTCDCNIADYWDGQNCVPRTECPCVVNHITYKIGQSYVKEDCKECFCKLGGDEHCVEKQCEKCKEGLQSKISNTCACLCSPCPDDEILCPTSNVCINKSKWCDGVTDCPDDEVNCAKPTEPTTTEIPKKDCPIPVCSPGYELKEKTVSKGHNYLNFLATMFNRRPTKHRAKTSYSYTKTKSTKHFLTFKKPSETEKIMEAAEEKCKEYICVPTIETPICPPASCPPGYTPVYNPAGSGVGFCTGYKCHLPDAICNITGRTFNTFDNTEFKYDICSHVIARDLIGTNWDIALKKKCDKTRCYLKVLINHNLDSLTLYSDLKTIKYNGYTYNTDQMEKLSQQSQDFNLNRLGEMILFSSTKYGFWVSIDKVANIKVGVSSELTTQVDGLCGYYNGYGDDDKRKPDGTLAKTSMEFGDSWAFGDHADCEIRKCPEDIERKAIEICNRVKDQTLAPCASAINIEAFLSRCLETTCMCLQESKGNETGEDNCRCSTLQAFVIDCMESDSSMEVGNWRAQHNCPIACKAPLMPHDCYRRPCELTCETVSDPNACPKLDTVCFPGCYCPPGFVRQGDTCIQPPACKDCECNVLPHLQYITYDESNFTVSGNCVYVMSRDVLEDLNKEHKFQVFITNHPCENKANKMCVGKVTILFAGHKIHILKDGIRNKLKMIVDAERIYDFGEIADWLEVKETKSKHFKILLKAVQIHVTVYYPSLGVSVKAPSQKYGGKMEGLCGDCNGDKTNDMLLPNGQVTTDAEYFGTSWYYDKIPGQTKETCAPTKEEQCVTVPADSDPCDQLLDVHKFGLCHPLLDPAMFIEWCKKDICSGDLGQACTAIEAYAKECMSSDICINWRTNLCPAESCPADQEYEPCGTNCPKTCDSIKETNDNCQHIPVEGCFCPEGKVLRNNTCVEERECVVCDEEGHHPGDTWHKDACTTCSCVGINVKCETMHCPKVETLCEDGYSATKVASDKTECCEKYVCVPVKLEGPTCEPPQQLKCNDDQEMKLIKKSDGCQKFVCECKPVEECISIEELMNKTVEEGYEKVVNKDGCCPTVSYVCKKELCAEPEQCPTFYNVKKLEIPEKCCPIYSCEAPKKCIVDLIYTSSDMGGEKLRNENDKQKLLKESGEKWQDGPCRECECSGALDVGFHSNCLQKNCPRIEDSEDKNDYIVEYEPIPYECCAAVKRVACKYDDKEYTVGEKWPVKGDYCAFMQCVNTSSGIQRTTERLNCDTKCDLGYEYVAASPESGLCCGSCKPYACVVDGMIKAVEEKWLSPDYCTEFVCINDNGVLRVDGKVETCLDIPQDQLEEFVFESHTIEKECCKKHKAIACKVGDTVYQVGETWPSPDLDKCKKVSCVKSQLGDIIKQENVETCNRNCSSGWEYTESDVACCGECVSVFCVVEGDQLRRPDETWTSEDGCTKYSCERHGDQLSIVSQQESCPNLDFCAEENIYLKGCCKYCNMTVVSQVKCAPQEIPQNKTVGLFRVTKPGGVICKNDKPISGLIECQGSCESYTAFNIHLMSFESQCSCCRALDYNPAVVNLLCDDNTTITKELDIPTSCSCEGCAAQKLGKLLTGSPTKTFTKTKSGRKVR